MNHLTATTDELRTEPISSRAKQDASDNRAKPNDLLKDRELVDRCLAGDVDAWDQFYNQCHEPLLDSIETMLRPWHIDLNLVDEIAARVWYALIENDGKLLAQYHPRRNARLITFLRAVAKTHVKRHFREQRRRRKRERTALAGMKPYDLPDVNQPTPSNEDSLSTEDFLSTLTRQERKFCEDRLADPEADDGNGAHDGNGTDQECSSANARQLGHRIQKKLLKFLRYES